MVTARISQVLHKQEVVNLIEHSLSDGKIEIGAYETIMGLVDILDPARDIVFEISTQIR